MTMPALNPIDKDVREALQAIAASNPELIARFGAISAIQPTAPAVQRKAIGYIQAPSILGYLAPDVVAGADRPVERARIGERLDRHVVGEVAGHDAQVLGVQDRADGERIDDNHDDDHRTAPG